MQPPLHPRNPPKNAEDRKIVPIPLPWFIPLCVFAPFFMTFILFVLYHYTIKRPRAKKALQAPGSAEQKVSKDVEMQVRMFVHPMEGRGGSGLSVIRL
ncbi:hypothetical protein BDW02DRAFT_494809 [Decorospora gaudefroyi]|uniref:Uncharacterized protein n=1 Tax=Decorospora gaudefroyi TaxID=184978 RepID=A0A6A5KJF0_9PLEO|nr:hypothetical protein BDW02DRAFT_494809 [Decorospora gaudefroyi]